MVARGLLVLLLVFQVGLAFGDEDIDTRRKRREREHKELLLQSLIRSKVKGPPEFFSASHSPIRCAEIEYYLRSVVKMRAEVKELALIVESHDPKLVPTRVYRVKYEDRKGKSHTHDFIMQQAGSDWAVKAHVAPIEIVIAEPEPEALPQ